MRDQTVAVHQKLVALGFATENGMVVEHQARLALARLPLENQRRCQTADASAYDHTIVNFTSVDNTRGKALESAITNLMSGFEHAARISVRVRVVANATITGKVIFIWLRVGLRCEQIRRRHR